MSDVLMWFEATAVFHGSKEDGGKHWKMIADVLKALGCVDIHLRETEVSEAARAASGQASAEGSGDA